MIPIWDEFNASFDALRAGDICDPLPGMAPYNVYLTYVIWPSFTSDLPLGEIITAC